VFNSDFGQFASEVLELLGVFGVLTQLCYFGCGNSSADIATILPCLVFVVRAESEGAFAVWGGTFAPFFGEGSGLHGGDSSNFFEQGFAISLVGYSISIHKNNNV